MRDKNLVNALREHAEWARANEWETPITLGDDLAEAADLIEAQAKEIEKLRGQLRHLCRGCDLDRLEELAEADKDGRLMVLQCKVGDTVWYKTYIDNGSTCIGVQPHKVKRIDVRVITDGDVIDTEIPAEQFGRTAFCTSEATEKALEAMKDE